MGRETGTSLAWGYTTGQMAKVGIPAHPFHNGLAKAQGAE